LSAFNVNYGWGRGFITPISYRFKNPKSYLGFNAYLIHKKPFFLRRGGEVLLEIFGTLTIG